MDFVNLKVAGKAVTRVVKRCDLAKQNKKLGLDLSRNNLTTLPESLREITQLRRIDISCNSFNDLPSVIFGFKKLTHLNAQQNYIQELEHIDDLTKLEHLQMVNLLTNPFNEVTYKRLKEIRKFLIILSPQEETARLHRLEQL
ncbi:leucine-rich repeat protein soc-2 homolog isoform X2 [Gordionus sp. m RMFG-2023]|uniref:leucine-rich repeat protein soc-2 homolog isoform X2 n=1 Tax=Gordionus sp. m RMFG-2023 TaxID=3053472 RepID=UPI0031FE37CF